jgi:rhodanese-related sulfurtransferase
MTMYSSDNRKPTCCSRGDLSAYKVETAEDRKTVDSKSKPPKKNTVTDKTRHVGFAMTLAVSVLMASALFAGDQGVKKGPAQMPATSPCDTPHQVPKSNTTSLGLYVSPQEAYDMWKADPDGVHILDVRTFEEYLFVGHVEAAKNVPVVFPKYDPEGPSMPGRPPGCSGDLNTDFVAQVKAATSPDAVILVMCSTGGRAAIAVNQLAKAGFVNVYNIVNGLEGEIVDDPGSAYFGKHMKNGWKNCGLPWTYSFNPDLMWVSPDE